MKHTVTFTKDSQGWYYNINGVQSVINLSSKAKAEFAAKVAIRKGKMWNGAGFSSV